MKILKRVWPNYTVVWKETKMEYEVDEAGNELPKKITREADFKLFGFDRSLIDFILRFTGFLAIVLSAIAIYINFKSQSRQLEAQRKQQKGLFELGLYANAIKGINVIMEQGNDSATTQAYRDLKQNIYPVIELLDNDLVTKELDRFNQAADFFQESGHVRSLTRAVLSDLNNDLILSESFTHAENRRLRTAFGALHARCDLLLHHWQRDSFFIKNSAQKAFQDQEYASSIVSQTIAQLQQIDSCISFFVNHVLVSKKILARPYISEFAFKQSKAYGIKAAENLLNQANREHNELVAIKAQLLAAIKESNQLIK